MVNLKINGELNLKSVLKRVALKFKIFNFSLHNNVIETQLFLQKMCARELSTSLYFSKWIFRDFIFQIIFSSSSLSKKETADASSVSGGCCTESLNCHSLFQGYVTHWCHKLTETTNRLIQKKNYCTWHFIPVRLESERFRLHYLNAWYSCGQVFVIPIDCLMRLFPIF